MDEPTFERRRVARWVGKALATLTALAWVTVGVLSAAAGREPWTAQSAVFAALGAVLVVGAALSWRRERAGGAVLVAAGLGLVAFALAVAGHNRLLAAAAVGGPPLLAGWTLLGAGTRRTG